MFENAARNKAIASVRRAATAAFAAVLAVATALSLSACQVSTEPDTTLSPELASGTTITDGVLTVGINGSDSPYGGTSNRGETVGLDVDVAGALADELGMKLQIVDVESSDGRSALENGQVDIALDQTPSNAAQPTTLTYSTAYINDGTSIYCLAENAPKSVKSVKVGKGKVLAQANTASAYAVQETLGKKHLQTTETLQEAFDALESGDQTYLAAYAVIGDYFARNYSDIQRVGFASSESVTPVYALMLSSNAELVNAVNEAFDTMSQNGVLRVVAAKWLGTQSSDLLPGNVDISDLPESAFDSK